MQTSSALARIHNTKIALYAKSHADITIPAVLAFIYFLTAKFGLSLAFINPNASAVWPATGLAIAATVMLGYRRALPGIFAGALLANVANSGALSISLGIALGNTLEAFIAAYLIERYAGGRAVFAEVGNVFRFSIITGFIAPAVSATIGTASVLLGNQAVWAHAGGVWVTWWLGDLGGAFVITPVIMLLWRLGFRDWIPNRRVQAVASLGLLFAISSIVFFDVLPALVPYAFAYMALPPLIFIAFAGRRETVISTLLLASIAVWGTVQGFGVFARGHSPEAALVMLQMFLSAASMSSLMFSTLIYQRRKAEKVVIDNEQRFRSLVEHSSDLICLINKDGIVNFLTESAERMTGYPARELMGKNWFHIVFPDDQERIREVAVGLESKPGAMATMEFRIHRRGGAVRWAEAVIVNSVTDSAIEGFVVTIRDVTERKELQLAKNRFVSTISHRLYPPLSQVNGYLASLALRKQKFGPLERKYLEQAQQANQNMSMLVNDLVRLMRIELGTLIVEPQATNVCKAIEAAVHDFSQALSARAIVVEKKFPSKRVPLISVDQSLISVILHRVLLWVLELVPANGSIEIGLVDRDGRLQIKISYPDVISAKAFLPLATDSNLSVEFSAMQGLAQLMGGTIDYESAGRGGSFTLAFARSKVETAKN
jgi:PAS domain S-box-containing protein